MEERSKRSVRRWACRILKFSFGRKNISWPYRRIFNITHKRNKNPETWPHRVRVKYLTAHSAGIGSIKCYHSQESVSDHANQILLSNSFKPEILFHGHIFKNKKVHIPSTICDSVVDDSDTKKLLEDLRHTSI